MHDIIHGAIANARVRDLVDQAEVRRASRRPKRERAQAEAPQTRPQPQHSGSWARFAAKVRLRPRTM